ncbi:MAG: PAS domain S-box protein, partial [Terracidiphilus sp.]
MSERPEALTEQTQPAPVEQGGVSQLWLILPLLIVFTSVGAALARLFPHFPWGSLPVVAALLATALFALLLNRQLRRVGFAQDTQPIAEGLRELLDSAGPAVVAVDLGGRLIYCNPATERVLGYRTPELLERWGTLELLAPGEAERLVMEMQKLCRVERPAEANRAGLMAAYMQCVRMLPPSTVPSFDAKVRRKDGVQIPVMLHISALRDALGELTGLVVVAVDQTDSQNREQVQRESQERYRDLFEHSTEMIATLSPAGQFLYANPAWKRCFGVDQAALLDLRSFEELFSEGVRDEVAALFRRALDGEMVDRIPLRHHTLDGRLLELELSLSRRQKTGVPLAVRCLMRDVTQQKQRENRLALQLAVSQIVGENASGESAGMRILEALCISQGWDVAIEWVVGAEQKHLEFGTAWGVPGRNAEALIQGSMGLTLTGTSELLERAWREGRTVWATDLEDAPASGRVIAALKQEMVSGWAVPVRAGSKVLAVLEFYCSFRLREDREAMAAIETAAASLGQLLARTQERGRAEELSRQQEVLLDAVAEGICGLDRQGKVTFANPAAARLL